MEGRNLHRTHPEMYGKILTATKRILRVNDNVTSMTEDMFVVS